MVNPLFIPNVSVIIPIYNGESDLSDLLDCLRSQTYPRDRIEYLLIDNNSSDQTADLLSQAVESAQAENFPLKALSENQIQSSYAARNHGIRKATGKILIFTDADCRPDPHWVENIVIPFSDPTIGIVVGELHALVGQSLLEQYAEHCQMMSQHFLVEHPYCPYGQTANLAIRQAIFAQIGLFRPFLTTGGDADICWRIQQQTAWTLTTAALAIVRHRHRDNLEELRQQWHRYGRSNRYLHELYGVSLMKDLTWAEGIYRVTRWLWKELPLACLKWIQGKASFVDLLITPIDLIIYQARTKGQKEARLPKSAHKIAWLDEDKDSLVTSGFNLSSKNLSNKDRRMG